MSILSKLFGGKTAAAAAPASETYNGFRIIPEPVKEGGQHRIAARIEMEIGGETRVHRMIRADTLPSEEAAIAATLHKAKQLIDQQGDRIF